MEESLDRGQALVARHGGIAAFFFQVVENELKRTIGPVASFIIDDQLVEFGETQDSFPEDQALSFVEALGEDIQNEIKKKEFKRVMMEFLSLKK